MNLTETLFKVKLTEDIQFAKCGKKLIKNTEKKKMQNGGTNPSYLDEGTKRRGGNPTLVTESKPDKNKKLKGLMDLPDAKTDTIVPRYKVPKLNNTPRGYEKGGDHDSLVTVQKSDVPQRYTAGYKK